jgi:hypothetical protein
MFLMIILGATDERAPSGFAPIPIGLGLTLIHLIGIPVTNLSVNPARSTGPALIVGGWAIEQLWLFWLAPIAGAVLAGLVYPALSRNLTKCQIGGGFVISSYPVNSTVRRSGRQMPVLRKASLKLAGSRTSSEVVCG